MDWKCWLKKGAVMAGTGTAVDQVVLTTEGRARLVDRIDATRRAVAELPHDHEDRPRLQSEIAVLEESLEEAVVVADVDEDPSIVEVGDEVLVLDEEGEQEWFSLVHPLEVSHAPDNISVESPLGRSLLGHKVGELINVDAPIGRYPVTIVSRRRLR